MIKAILFDLDGTLIDTLTDLYTAVNHALVTHGLKKRTMEEIREFVGNGVRHLMTLSTDNALNQDQFDIVFRSFSDYYESHAMVYTKPYQGIHPLIKELKTQGLKVGVISNKVQSAVNIVVPHFFGSAFDLSLGESPLIKRKPSPDMILHALKQLDLSNDEVIFVGDSEVDLQTASAAQVKMIAVTWGFRTADFLKLNGAYHVVNTTDELLDNIKLIQSSSI